eukprot:jgi/Bigna1/144053/aug1.83_g18761
MRKLRMRKKRERVGDFVVASNGVRQAFGSYISDAIEAGEEGEKSPWKALLANGPVEGFAQVDGKGKLIPTIANRGIELGQSAKNVKFGLTIRVLEPFPPILSHQSIAYAMESLAHGKDVQHVKNKLFHDDALSIGALIKLWHQSNGMQVPPTYANEDIGVLSDVAKQRAQLRWRDDLPVAFVLEEIDPGKTAISADCIGQRFANGDEFARRFTDIGVRATLGMQLRSNEKWMRKDQIEAIMRAQKLSPQLEICVGYTTARLLRVAIRRYRAGQGSDEAGGCSLHRLIRGHIPLPNASRVVKEENGELGEGEALPNHAKKRHSYQQRQRSRSEHKTKQNEATSKKGSVDKPSPLPNSRGRNAHQDLGGSPSLCVGVLSVDPSLLPHLERNEENELVDEEEEPGFDHEEKPDQGVTEIGSITHRSFHRRRNSGHDSTLFSRATKAALQLRYPALLMQRCIRRGLCLSGPQSLVEAIEVLARAGNRHSTQNPGTPDAKQSGTFVFAWRLFVAALEDVGPFRKATRTMVGLDDLLAISLIAMVDSRFVLPEPLLHACKNTALALQANDEPESHWPWRGFRADSSEKLLENICSGFEGGLRPSGNREEKANAGRSTKNSAGTHDDPKEHEMYLRNSIRAAIMLMPLNAGEQNLLLRYLSMLSPAERTNGKRGKNKKVKGASNCQTKTMLKGGRNLMPLKAYSEDDTHEDKAVGDVDLHQVSVAEDRARLCAFDHQFHSNMLLFLQASLPYPPREASQHSLRALSGLVWRLSSGVNARTSRRDGGPRQELFRIMQFMGKDTSEDEDGEGDGDNAGEGKTEKRESANIGNDGISVTARKHQKQKENGIVTEEIIEEGKEETSVGSQNDTLVPDINTSQEPRTSTNLGTLRPARDGVIEYVSRVG